MSSYTHTREAVRVKVKKCEPNVQPEWRKFSVDPQITTLEVLYSLLAKAFDIKTDFSIKYKAFDPAGNELYLPVLSEWDLDAAFLRIHNIAVQSATEPCLMIQIDVKPFTEMKDFEAETPTGVINPTLSASAATSTTVGAREIITPLQQSIGVSQKYVQHMQTRLPGLIMNQMEKTISIMQKAFNMNEEVISPMPPRLPVSDPEFHDYLDALGQIERNDELRKAIFLGGIDPSLRRVVWKHLLNVYPSGMNGHQRMDFMRRKAEHYYKLRETWKTAIKQGCVNSELAYVTSMVKKDVLRTDRLHPFYEGSDDNQHIAELFNILTTYALNHPTVSYCQGMSDIASPLLVTMKDEAQAYICFCAIMNRMRGNFMLDGIAMTQKFAHLTEALSHYDPQFWEYLKSQQADDLLFCYRWLLLELKREFPFEEALRMLEVQWSSLKYANCQDLPLFEKEFDPTPEPLPVVAAKPTTASPSFLLAKPRENAYTKVCALRRQSSSASLSSLSSSYGNSSNALTNNRLDTTKHLNQSLDENIARHAVVRRHRRASAKAHQSLDEAKMLMLIEGIEGLEKLDDDCKSTDVTSSDITDDEVFSNNSPALETIQFDFHPTNPFKDDAHDNKRKDTSDLNRIDKLNQTQSDSSSTAPAHMRSPTAQIPKSIMNLQHKNVLSNYNTVSNIIAKQLANANNVSENVRRMGSNSGGHFKDLKDKIAATSKKGMTFEEANGDKTQQKLVKNFNEFLNFSAKNKNKISDKFVTASGAQLLHEAQQTKTPSPSHPLVQLSRSGYNSSFESDTSSVMDTTWSNSTAPTALQQAQTLSSHSLQLDLHSLPYTPDLTPTIEHRADTKQIAQVNKKYDSPDEQDYSAITRELQLEAENLDRQIFGDVTQQALATNSFDIEYEQLDKDAIEQMEPPVASNDVHEIRQRRHSREEKLKQKQLTQDNNIKANPFLDEVILLPPNMHLSTSASLPEVIVPLDTTLSNDISTPIDEMATNAADEIVYSKAANSSAYGNNTDSIPVIPAPILPPPSEFGGGNPFLMFLCLTLLLQHRNTIIKNAMDYNEIAMHFDKMVRKHDVTRVLNQARRMYIDYLKEQNAYNQQLQKQKDKLNEQKEQLIRERIAADRVSSSASGDANANQHHYKNRSSFKTTRPLQPMSS